MDIKQYYIEANALLEGHFLLSSGNHSAYYLQSAKVLESPKIAEILLGELARQIKNNGIEVDCVCSPAIGGILAGYELARALGVNFIFTERVNGAMTLRRGFSVERGAKVLICEDIITTGGSAVESAHCVESMNAKVVTYASLANRGFCKSTNLKSADSKAECKLPQSVPFFTLENFDFEMFAPENCPLCKQGSIAIKPGSRGN